MTACNNNDAHVSFEVALGRLEAIVEALERGDLSLEEAMAKFEEGVALSRQCLRRLNEAEARMEQLLTEEDGTVVLKPLNLEGGTSC